VNYGLESAGIVDGEGLVIIFGRDQVEAAAFVKTMVESFVKEVPDHVKLSDLYRAFGKYALLHHNTNFGLPAVGPGVKRIDTVLDDDTVRFVRLSVAIYGRLPTAFLGVSKAPVDETWDEDAKEDHEHSDVDNFCKITGIPTKDIIAYNLKGRVYGPGHIIALDRKSNSLVVVVRGTIRHHDALTDLVCAHAEFTPTTSLDMMEDAVDETPGAHSGMLKSATRLGEEIRKTVEIALLQNPGFRLVITGHSLGAGVATLLAASWGPRFYVSDAGLYAPTVCFAYAPPCTLTLNSARSVSPFITSIVCGADVVSRFGISTTEDLREALLAIIEREDDLIGMDKDDQLRWLIDNVQTAGPKMFPGGRVLWLKTGADVEFRGDEAGDIEVGGGTGSGVVFEADNAVFHTMAMRPAMFKNHMPNSYLKEVEKLSKTKRV
jgi:hypothetical protein